MDVLTNARPAWGMLCLWALLLITATPVHAQQPLRGWVDMHAHPMAHLGYSGKFLHGAPDVGCLIPTDGDCNSMVRATSMPHAMGDCNATHGGHNLFTNRCGDHLRMQFISQLEAANGAQSMHGAKVGGYQDGFAAWPACNDISHQTMWVDWVRRSHRYGQRVMVALAVNSEIVSAALGGPGDMEGDDRSVARLQVEEMKAMVARHGDFMEVAYDAADLRRIVGGGKLAVVLGIEMDNIGNLRSKNPDGTPLTRAQVDAALQELHDMGVRYVFPVHVLDNAFAGTALMQSFFNLANYRESGACWSVEAAQPADSIDFRYSPPLSKFMLDMLKLKVGCNLSLCPESTPDNAEGGQANRLGLTEMGRYALGRMMDMGMMIDVDHMSQRGVNESLALAEAWGGYPINSGHNGLRTLSPAGHRNENGRTAEQYRRIVALGGMVGLGMGRDAEEFLRNARVEFPLLGYRHCAFGTDMNGMMTQPKPRMDTVGGKLVPRSQVQYGPEFEMCRTGDRTWDYNREGVAHYGLLPDYVRDIAALGGTREVEALDLGAEDFAQMWERCERVAAAPKGR